MTSPRQSPGSRILVTGAAGLIGSAVTRLLAARGHSVIACDDFSIGTWRDTPEHVEWEQLDVAGPAAIDCLARHEPDVVVHGAAHPGGRSLEEPSENVRVNTVGAMQIFDWCARSGTPVVYLSSSAVYGEQPSSPICETASLRPGTIYAVCKAACEGFLRTLEAAHGLQWTVLRLFATYGAGHRPGTHQGIVNVMLTQLLANGTPLVVRGSLSRVRDLLYVDDAAEAVAACALASDRRGRVLNVGTGRGLTVRYLIGALCTAIGRAASDVMIVEEPGTPGDPLYSVADITALRTAIDFEPQVPLEDGLARLVAARRGH